MSRITTEDRWVIGSIALTLAGIILGALLAEPRAFGITALIVIGLLFIVWSVTHSPRLSWLLVFGLVTGVLELWADWVHVVYFHSVVYTNYFGFQLLASPSYMPIAWWLTVVQFGYLALRLADRWPAWAAVGVATALGMTLPPWYEEFAALARAWYYPPHGVMLSHTPLWIIFTYGGCMFAIASSAVLLYRPRAWGRAVIAGLFTAACIMFSGVIWFALLGATGSPSGKSRFGCEPPDHLSNHGDLDPRFSGFGTGSRPYSPASRSSALGLEIRTVSLPCSR